MKLYDMADILKGQLKGLIMRKKSLQAGTETTRFLQALEDLLVGCSKTINLRLHWYMYGKFRASGLPQWWIQTYYKVQN